MTFDSNTIALFVIVGGWLLAIGRSLQVLRDLSRVVKTIEQDQQKLAEEQHKQDKRILALEITKGKRK